MFSRRKKIPIWAGLSLSANMFLGLLLIQGQQGIDTGLKVEQRRSHSQMSDRPSSIPGQAYALPVKSLPDVPPDLPEVKGPSVNSNHHLTYQEWVELLAREAQQAAAKPPENLSILAGDSISLWFPPALLPSEGTWLNQGISGETSLGLYRRLPLLDGTQPQRIFILIGINDLLKGIKDREVLNNQRNIIQDLKWNHPQTQVVIQSILPHQGASATWEGRDRLLAIPNERIRRLNQQLRALAHREGVYYLDLYPLFATAQGSLRTDLTTDGLHLNHQGYLIWSTAMQMFSQMHLNSTRVNP